MNDDLRCEPDERNGMAKAPVDSRERTAIGTGAVCANSPPVRAGLPFASVECALVPARHLPEPVRRLLLRRPVSVERVLASVLAGLLLACSEPSPPAPPLRREPPTWDEGRLREAELLEAILAELPPAPPSAVSVRLVYGAGADLDLYVSDPLQESIYYGNTPSVSGGALDRDLRCEDPAPRIERVDFAAPPPGRYRVSVDHPERCAGVPDGEVMTFAIAVDARGKRRITRGLIRAVTFLPVVFEFEVAGPPRRR